MPNNHPLLFFPEPISLQKKAGVRFIPKSISYPSNDRQTERLSPLFDALCRSFEHQRVDIQNTPVGIDPEQVLVFETIGNVENFIIAIGKTDGLEWMGEIELDDICPSDDFHYTEVGSEEKSLHGRLFLTMTNQRAMTEMLSLWREYSANPNIRFRKGLNGFKALFKQLYTIRRWDVQDRLIETNVIEYWKKDIEANEQNIRFELQLWYSASAEKRDTSFRRVSTIVESLNGRCLVHSVIEEISYHSILVELPSTAIQDIISTQDTQLVRCDQVMFFRPSGQIAIVSDIESDGFVSDEFSDDELPSGEPEAAIFDGLPVNNHQKLSNRIMVDDPDDYSDGYTVQHRVHGTAMSSLIIHGDINDNEKAISTPLYIRPIMKPVAGMSSSIEKVPSDVLFVDLLHRAVKRLFDGEGDSVPIDSIKLINLSIGDSSLLFFHSMSPAAKLLDWLSWKYNVLFIISAGNHVDVLEMSTSYRDFKALSDQQKEYIIYNTIINDRRNRRILSPSESMNNITVGSISVDNSPENYCERRINPTLHVLPNVYSSFGGGYRKSIKPDFVYYGGRQFFDEPFSDLQPMKLKYSCHFGTPGNRVAAPADDLSKTWFVRGTSNAAALITRRGIQITDTLKELFQENYFLPQYRQYLPLIIKTLLTHGCSWGELESNLKGMLNSRYNNNDIEKIITDWTGYGIPDTSKVQECTQQRVTILGFGEIGQDKSHLFKFPLPPSLSGIPENRKLTITLSWFTPIASNTQKYRVANLYFEADSNTIGVTRDDVQWQKVKKGTLQHEVFVGQNAVAFEDDGNIAIQVTCKKDAISFDYLIPYSIAVTLEVAEEIDIPIYQEVRDKLLTPVIVEQSSLF
ncbi:S8 family peptidase [Bacteroides neonati]|uniref:S8 family peptidase n=1 Tax=Bacteroides neonati TaxID=1347393 RepID=UPI0004B907AD|nr:S8 family peptidase [Bacteroides neonati]